MRIRHLFDGGGNVGLFSIAMAGAIGIEDIVAVEPDAANFALMQENLRCFSHAITVNAALAQAAGVAQLIRHSSNRTFGQFQERRIGGALHSAYRRPVAARMGSIGHLSQNGRRGCEYEVLPDVLRSGIRPAIVAVEMHDYVRMHGQRLIDALREAGYSIAVEGYGTEGRVCRQIFATRPYGIRPPD